MSTEHRPGGHGKPKECECGETKDLIYYGSAWQCSRCARRWAPAWMINLFGKYYR